MSDDTFTNEWPPENEPVEEPSAETPTFEEPPLDAPGEEEPPIESPGIEEPPAQTPDVEESPVEESAPEAASDDDSPFEEERAFVDTGSVTAELEAVATRLEETEPAADSVGTPEEVRESGEHERRRTSHVGEDVVLLGEPGSAPGAESAIVSADGSVLAVAPTPGTVGSEMDLGPERRGGGLWIWIGLFVGVLIMAAAIGYAWWYMNERPITVPDVAGRLPAQAAQALNDAGLRVGKVTETPTDTAPTGTVIGQSPKAKSELKPGDAVSLVLAGSPLTSDVPDVVGDSLRDAMRTLASSRLFAEVVESYNATVAAGFVQAQVPTAGAEIEPTSVVALLVSKGPQPSFVRVPKVVGMNETDAAALLGILEVRSDVFRSFENSIPAGVVVTQTPLPDMQVPFDGVIHYLVSAGRGANSVRVPDVVRHASDAAVSRLKELGLKAKIVTQASSVVPKGQVIAQTPPARARTASGETVGLIVSGGETTPTAVPNVVGKPADEASRQMAALGYVAVKIEARTSAVSAGAVYLQLPSPGTAWMPRYPVVLLVAIP